MKLLKDKTTRNAILFTFIILFIYRIGYYVITPLANGNEYLGSTPVDSFFAFMGGGNLKQLSIFALGISPYITASIVVQLLESDLIPSMAEWKHQGVDGQNKRSAWTKNFAIIFAFVQALGISFAMSVYYSQAVTIEALNFSAGSIVNWNEYLVIALFITAGTAFLMWLGDRITEKGIGNGMSVLIMIGILASLPQDLNAIIAQIQTSFASGQAEFIKSILVWSVFLLLTILLIIGVTIYALTYVRVKINYVKSSRGKVSKDSYLPIKLNPAGVIPIIFGYPLMQIPVLVFLIPKFASNGVGPIQSWITVLFDVSGSTVSKNATDIATYIPHYQNLAFIPIIIYAIIIILFSIMYSYIQMNPEQMSESLEKQSAYVIGVRPGIDTEKYFTKLITKTTIWGGSVLAILAILPMILQQVGPIIFTSLGLSGAGSIRMSLIGTGLIITVSVLVQTYDALKNKTESKDYKVLFNLERE